VVKRTQVDLEARDQDSRTPLLTAARHGHLPVVQYLCEQGTDKEARDQDGEAPLLRAELAAKHDFDEEMKKEKGW